MAALLLSGAARTGRRAVVAGVVTKRVRAGAVVTEYFPMVAAERQAPTPNCLDFGWQCRRLQKSGSPARACGKGALSPQLPAPQAVVEALLPRPNPDWPRFFIRRRFCQPKNHVAIPFARFAERPEPVDEPRIEPDLNLSVWAFGRRSLVDPGRVRLKGLVSLLGDRDADHAASLSRAGQHAKTVPDVTYETGGSHWLFVVQVGWGFSAQGLRVVCDGCRGAEAVEDWIDRLHGSRQVVDGVELVSPGALKK
jgi:hypothetical protein